MSYQFIRLTHSIAAPTSVGIIHELPLHLEEKAPSCVSPEFIHQQTFLPLEIALNKDKAYINTKKFTMVIANDDENACFLIEEALQEVPLAMNIYFVEDGEELLDYLYCRGQYASPNLYPRPDLILLDLNMPRLNGREALKEIKSNPKWRHIPIVILTTSRQEKDIFNCYSLGANSFIVKPLTFKELVKVMTCLCRYWFEIVSLPSDPTSL
ncbi:response regulator [Argonema galeatum]|uniref:response regulator n=1 Tax=Argonema galeatum TaxID=2942762 RepID=UPI0020120352|nr:response regulator [Argonema galeatum]MCL1465207.1 response regulator [Argonema galeatum A003/A1]